MSGETLEEVVVVVDNAKPIPQVGDEVVHRNYFELLIEGVVEALPTEYNPKFIIRDNVREDSSCTSQTWLLPEQLKSNDELEKPGDWYCV